MSIPRSVFLKLERAKEHLETLADVHEKFLATRPYEITRTIEASRQAGRGAEHRLVWSRFETPPEALGLLIGDTIHNLRSALDHLAFELASHGAQQSGKVMTPSQERSIQFPIARSARKFSENVRRGALKFVEAAPRKFIEDRQPFNTMSKHPDKAFLAIVSALDNLDKHRTINVVSAFPSISKDNWPVQWRGSYLRYPTGLTRHGLGEEIGYFEVPNSLTAEDLPLSFGYGLVVQGIEVHSRNIPDLLSAYIDSTENMTILPICDKYLP